MADQLDVPVMVLHQLSRETEKRDGNKPRLSDLRESGDVEQDADLVIFPHRDSYFGKTTDERDSRKAEFIVAKQRNGPTGVAQCEYIKEHGLWRDVEAKASLWT
jgi:replicative DNA helicase